MHGYCKLLRTDVKRNVKIIRNQNEQLLLLLSICEVQAYWERVNAEKTKFFNQMWNVSSLCGATSRIKRSFESQIRGRQNVRNINPK